VPIIAVQVARLRHRTDAHRVRVRVGRAVMLHEDGGGAVVPAFLERSNKVGAGSI
jgi:hypothetical protein